MLENIRQSKATDTDEIHPNAGGIFDGQDGWGAIAAIWQPVFLLDHQDADGPHIISFIVRSGHLAD